jgi:hypothetical protein
MFTFIITHTPLWIWALLAGLLVLGWSQTKQRQASLIRITIMPLVMIGLSLYGTISVFGSASIIVVTWLLSVLLSLSIFMSVSDKSGIHYDQAKHQFTLPGSWIPMVLILSIFITKYIVGFMTAMQPNLTQQLNFTLACTVIYGLFSGVFLARAAILWRIALNLHPTLQSKAA